MRTKNICIWCEKEPIVNKKRGLGKKCFYRWYKENKKFKKCKIVGCEKVRFGKGFCSMHYLRARNGIEDMRPGTLPYHGWAYRERKIKEICIIEGCNKKQYAKGYCHYHYNRNRIYGDPLYKRPVSKRPISICTIDGCNDKIVGKGLCRLHWSRQRNGTVLTKEKGNSAELNHRWKGGVSGYPNHSLMKKNRLIVLEKDNYKCFSCGKKANEIHHLDLSKDNHALENLVATCRKCNAKHRNPNIGYKSIYGLYLKEMREKLKLSENHIRYLHDKNQLKNLYIKTIMI